MMQMCGSKSALAFSAVFLSGIASAMTFSELQSKVDAAEPGDTVYVTSDIEFNGALTVAKKVTIASAEGGEKFVLRPAASYGDGTFLNLDSADADITFVNLVFDGQRGTTNLNNTELFFLSAGTVTLGAGAVIRNRYCPNYPAVTVQKAGVFVMEDGSEIRGIVSDNFGVAVKVQGTFRMNGGLITECAGHHKDTGTALWDGAVYLYGGTIYAHGGTICGNTSDYSTAGVCGYIGKLYISGDFTATNNVGGAANDVCRCYWLDESGNPPGDKNAIQIDGDYTGHMTLKMCVQDTPEDGKQLRYVYTSTANVVRRGCENIVSEDDPTLALDLSTCYGGWYPKWRRIAAKVAGKTNKFSYWDALDVAESGDTILLCKDVEFAKSTDYTKDVTVTSDIGGPYVIRRTSGNYIFAKVAGATVTFRDVILDGNSITNGASNGILEAYEGGVIVLDSGAVIRRCVVPATGGAVYVRGRPGAKLVMKDGALITECTCTGNGYGAVVCISEGADVAGTTPPTFEMQGGLITGCSSAGTGDVSGGYGGIVYCWNGGIFDMSGGSITGNTAENNSGVVNYLGTVKFTGSAVVENNAGAYPDVYNCNSRKTNYYGDFRGRVGISNANGYNSGEQAVGKSFHVSTEGDDATGAWCFHSTLAATELVGKVVDGSVVWAEPVGSVGGVKAATTDDLQLLLPTAFDLNVGSADYAKLPVVLTGVATGLGANVALTFDKDMRKHMPAWTQPLIAAGESETLTGAWTFVLPEGAEKNWSVNATDAAYSLAYLPSGMAVIIR